MTIDRCLCYQVRFARLKPIAEATGAETVAALQDEAARRRATFGQGCRLCHPYVRRMLRTGATTFHEVIEEADEPPPPG